MNKARMTVSVPDMECATCEKKLKQALIQLPGVLSVEIDPLKRTISIEHNPDLCTEDNIQKTICSAGYTIGPVKKTSVIIGLLVIFLAILLLGGYAGGTFDLGAQLKGQVTYFLLFIIGVLTSFHCIGMCGGIQFSQTVSGSSPDSKLSSVIPALAYNAGRVLSYTLLGAAVGAIGSVFSLSISGMAAITAVAGLLMILMGLNMAGFPLFRKYLRIPSLPGFSQARTPRTPFFVGLLNGLMPCGPLQTLQLYALSTGSAWEGGMAMLIFSLGTVPFMFAFGAITALTSRHYTKHIMKLSGVLVVVLGLIMASRGLAIAGYNLPFAELTSTANKSSGMVAKADIRDGVQIIKSVANSRGYIPGVLFIQKDIPVRWIIDGQQITSCNNEIVIPSLKIKKKLAPGENIIEFTPHGQDLSFSCWMGMISGVFKVVDNLGSVDVATTEVDIPENSSCGEESCCAEPLSRSGIFGKGLSSQPTDRLMKKAVPDGSGQSLTIKGSVNRLDPMVAVLQKGQPATLTFDLTAFDDPTGEWAIVDIDHSSVLYTFQGRKDIHQARLTLKEAGRFGIFQGNTLIGGLESVNDVKSADLEKMRSYYF